MLLPYSPPVITKVPSPAAQRKQRVTTSLFEGLATRWRPAAAGLLGHVPLGMHVSCFCTEKQQPAKHSRTVQLAGTSQWTCPEHKEGSAALLLLWWRDQTLLIFINYPAWSWFCFAINHYQPQIFQWIIPPMTFFLPIPFTEVDKKKKKERLRLKSSTETSLKYSQIISWSTCLWSPVGKVCLGCTHYLTACSFCTFIHTQMHSCIRVQD